MLENTKANVIGEIISDFTLNRKVFGENFYMAKLAVKRLSGQTDIIPLVVPGRLVEAHKDYKGRTMGAIGQFRSYIRHEGRKNHLMLFVFVQEIHFMEEFADYTKNNQIYLEGYICKKPIYRKTPLGYEITDLLVVVNRPYGKLDYIPCICWWHNARFASYLEAGTRICISGRIQSREYTKKITETECEIRTAYEVSINELNIWEESEDA